MKNKENRRINLYITAKCNYDCSYCVIHDNSLSHPSFDYKGWTKLLHDYRVDENEIIEIHIYGGEPLMHPDIKNIIKFLNTFPKIYVIILTNGSFLKDDSFKTLDVNFIVSYHKESLLKEFISNALRYKEQIISISYMYDSKDISKALSEYHMFEKLIKKEVVFWPAVNPLSDKKGHSDSINSIDEALEKELLKSDQNHFLINEIGQSTFKIWKEFGFFVDKEKASHHFDVSTCSFMGTYVIEVYQNRIYRCPADLHINTGISNYKKKPYITEYKSFLEGLQKEKFKCTQKKCLAFDHNYMTGVIKGIECYTETKQNE